MPISKFKCVERYNLKGSSESRCLVWTCLLKWRKYTPIKFSNENRRHNRTATTYWTERSFKSSTDMQASKTFPLIFVKVTKATLPACVVSCYVTFLQSPFRNKMLSAVWRISYNSFLKRVSSAGKIICKNQLHSYLNQLKTPYIIYVFEEQKCLTHSNAIGSSMNSSQGCNHRVENYDYYSSFI